MLRGIWAQDEFSFEGTGFMGVGVTVNPKPAKIPVWIGGNSALTRRRVAAHGDGWNPFAAPPTLARTARTVPLQGLKELEPILDHLWAQVDAAGRDRSEIDIATGEVDNTVTPRRDMRNAPAGSWSLPSRSAPPKALCGPTGKRCRTPSSIPARSSILRQA